MKKLFSFLFLFSIFFVSYSENSIQKFIKGNISEKITAVREAEDKETLLLSTTALDFVIDNALYLNEDRDLESLAIAAILSLPNDYGKNMSEQEKEIATNKFVALYKIFTKNSTVRISLLNKFLSLKDNLIPTLFTDVLNQDLQNNALIYTDLALTKTILQTINFVGNNASFLIVYNIYSENKISSLKNELENTLIALIPFSMNEILKIINSKNFVQIQRIYTIINKKTKISQNFISEIAENLLNEAILLMSSFSEKKQDLIAIQLGSLKILNDNECTRAASSVLSYFKLAKNEYKEKLITDEQFTQVIIAIGNLSPINSVSSLIEYLEELNKMVEKEQVVSPLVVTAVIKTLGAIGDKSAFDSLLAVTYLNYPDSVLTAARSALSGLKW